MRVKKTTIPELIKYSILIMVLMGVCIFAIHLETRHIILAGQQELQDTCIMIPTGDMLDDFCQAKGYKYGWIDQFNCEGLNEISCFKEV